jgi:hypothetical protein
MSYKGKRKAPSEPSGTHVSFRIPSVKRVHYTVTTENGTSRQTTTLARTPIVPATTTPKARDTELQDAPVSEPPAAQGAESKRTQVSPPFRIQCNKD